MSNVHMGLNMTDQKMKRLERPVSRRSVLRQGLRASTACLFVAPNVLGGPNHVAPSDQFRFGQIGAGGTGRVDLTHAIAAGARPVAFCDVDVQRAGKTYEMHPELPRYTDFREMMDVMHRELDAVVISTPDHGHGVQGLEALRRGKHVYLQTPLARTFDECGLLRSAALHAGVATQMGNQCRSQMSTKLTDALIASGRAGAVRSVHAWTRAPAWPQGMQSAPAASAPPISLDWDLWLGPASHRPFGRGYLPMSWRGWWDFGTGALGAMGCRWLDAAFVSLQLSMPDEVIADLDASAGVKATNLSFPTASKVTLRFAANERCPNGVDVHWYDGQRRPDLPTISPDDSIKDPGFVAGHHGCVMVGDRATIAVTSNSPRPEVVAVPGGSAESLRTVRAEVRRWVHGVFTELEQDRQTHFARWIAAARNGAVNSGGSSFDVTARMTQAILLGNIATRFPGQRLRWNHQAEQFHDAEAANSFLKMEPRPGFDLSIQ
ncbi:MAG: Gfo/Idh/MocA family oxidoreductase [Planctomycetota bacterium]